MAHAYNLSIQKLRQGDDKFGASLGCIGKCLSQKIEKQELRMWPCYW